MAVESIRKVREAEHKAKELVSEAAGKARLAGEEVRREAAGILKSAEQKAGSRGAEHRREVLEEAARETRTIRAEAEERRDEIHRLGLARMEPAVSAVTEVFFPPAP